MASEATKKCGVYGKISKNHSRILDTQFLLVYNPEKDNVSI
jgi:hypothetical protein